MRIQSYVSLGWTPILAVVSDGDRRVVQVTGWEGGSGTAPAAGLYVGPSGYVSNMADGVNISSGGVIFVDDEVPSGVINGVNGVFTLAHTPVTGSVKVSLNGLRLKNTVDYTISGSSLTMTTIPYAVDEFLVDYRY